MYGCLKVVFTFKLKLIHLAANQLNGGSTVSKMLCGLRCTVCGLQQQLAQVMRQAAEGEAAELATTLVEKMNIAETQQPDIQEALTVQHASMTGIQEGRETLDR